MITMFRYYDHILLILKQNADDLEEFEEDGEDAARSSSTWSAESRVRKRIANEKASRPTTEFRPFWRKWSSMKSTNLFSFGRLTQEVALMSLTTAPPAFSLFFFAPFFKMISLLSSSVNWADSLSLIRISSKSIVSSSKSKKANRRRLIPIWSSRVKSTRNSRVWSWK